MIPFDYTYRPLPRTVFISKSQIEGHGIFASDKLYYGDNIGETHFIVNGELKRTPLGGFLNDSNTPNAMISYSSENKESMQLIITSNIAIGEEITVDYSKCPCGRL